MIKPGALAVFATSALIGLILLIASVAQLLRYSPYDDPGAGTTGLWLGVFGLFLIGAPVALVAGHLFIETRQKHQRWLATLTPEQRAAVKAAEYAALIGADLLWHEHNKRESAQLTDSVMGRHRAS